MSLKQINGIVFKQMVINGANNLANRSKYVDQLNVFPVPDGDTGTNMSMTMTAGAKELVSLEEASIGKVMTQSLSYSYLLIWTDTTNYLSVKVGVHTSA